MTAAAVLRLKKLTGAGIVLEAMFVFFLVWTIVATAVNDEAQQEQATETTTEN